MKIRCCSFLMRPDLFAFAAFSCFLLSFSHAAQAQRLSANVIPLHYSLEFAPDLKAATYSGSEVLDVNIKQPTSTITLNALELKFHSVSVTYQNGEQKGSVSFDTKKEQATLIFPQTIPAGSATLHIHFTGILNHELRGFYLSKTAKRSYAVTQFESTDARRAFPCFDEPAFKATFQVKLTIDAGDVAISNTPIERDVDASGGESEVKRHTVTFEPTPKMSTYLLAFVVGDFQCISGEQDGVKLRVCATPDKVALTPYALNVAKFALHYYDNYFGIHYPLKKLDLIGIPDFEAGAMENFGAITFRETALLVDPNTASLREERTATIDIVHEMAHQWFGDLVTMQWWDNVWLNEGFATWMENKCAGAMHPEWNMPQFVAADVQRTLNIDAQPTTRAIRAPADTRDEIEEMFDRIAYDKSGAVLLMVENYLGEETFRKGVHAYLAAHEYGNATAEDFWNAQTEVSHKPVDKIMESLVEEPGEPLLEFGSPAAGQVPVAQSRFFLSPGIKPDPAQKWTLPVCFKADAGNEDCPVLEPSSPSLATPASRIFFANAGGKGYYRSAYAPAQYDALVADVETALSPEERISLTGDEWAQVSKGKAAVGDYLALVAALRFDPSSDVLSNAVDNVGIITSRVASNQEERDTLAAWVRRTFGPVYAHLGSASASDTPNQRDLRSYLFGILAFYGKDADVEAKARSIADQYLSNPASVDASLGQTALDIAAANGDAALFDRLQKIYETSGDPELQEVALRELVNFRNPDLLERALAYAVSSKVRNQDSAIQFNLAMRVPENRDQTWKFIQTHWDQVKTEFTPEMGEYFVAGTGNFCSVEAREEVKSFFASHPVPAADAGVRHAIERIDGCIELRRLQEPNLKQWLAAQGQ